MSEFRSVAKDICKLPTFLSTTLFRRIDVNFTGIVTRYAFLLLFSLFLVRNCGGEIKGSRIERKDENSLLRKKKKQK